MTGIKRTISLLLLCLPLWAMAQTKEDIEYARPFELKAYAQKAVAAGDVYLAIDYYERYLKAKPNKLSMAFELALLYERSRNYEQALTWFDTITAQAEDQYPLALYHKALMQQQLGQYEDAEWNFSVFAKKARGLADGKRYSKLAKAHGKGCDLAPALLDSVLDITLVHMDGSINRPNIELSPIALDSNQFAFASMRIDTVPILMLEEKQQELPHRQFYTATRDGKVWTGGQRWDVPFNDAEAEVGNGVLSPDGDNFYYTRCTPDWDHRQHCEIWWSKKVSGDWMEPERLGKQINDPRYSSTMPAIGTESDDGNPVLYFVSERPGGRGGKDVW